MARGHVGSGSAYTWLSALDPTWSLKPDPPLISCHLSYPSYLLPPVLIDGRTQQLPTVVPNRGGGATYGRCLDASLSRYPLRAVLRVTRSAVVRGLSTSPQACNSTVRFMCYIGPFLPMPRCCAITPCLQWLKKHTIWRGNEYSSWSLHTGLHPGSISGAWCSDFTALQEHVRLLVCPSSPTQCQAKPV